MDTPPAFLPYILGSVSFHSAWLASGCLPFQEDAHWEKQTALSRFKIGGPNQIQTLSIPVVHGSFKLWKDIAIDYSGKWIKEHVNSLKTAYGKSPFFEYYDYKLIPLFEAKPKFLKDLWIDSQQFICNALQLDRAPTLEKYALTNSAEKIEENSHAFIYPQVFEDRFGFREGLSVLDLIFNTGPDAKYYLMGQSL